MLDAQLLDLHRSEKKLRLCASKLGLDASQKHAQSRTTQASIYVGASEGIQELRVVRPIPRFRPLLSQDFLDALTRHVVRGAANLLKHHEQQAVVVLGRE